MSANEVRAGTAHGKYGVQESAGLVNGAEYHAQWHGAPTVPWTIPGLRIVRLRLLSDPGLPFWDVSYVHGELGTMKVHVEVPFSQLPKRGMKRAIVEAAIKDGVHAGRLGALDNISTLC